MAFLPSHITAKQPVLVDRCYMQRKNTCLRQDLNPGQPYYIGHQTALVSGGAVLTAVACTEEELEQKVVLVSGWGMTKKKGYIRARVGN